MRLGRWSLTLLAGGLAGCSGDEGDQDGADRAVAGAPCSWDLDCQEGLVCEADRCLAAPQRRDAAADVPPDAGTDASASAPRDAATAGRTDSGHPGGCVDPLEAGCGPVCGEPPCTELCGDVDGSGAVDHCDAAYLLAAETLGVC